MYHYIKGVIIILERDHIILDHHGMGYLHFSLSPPSLAWVILFMLLILMITKWDRK